MVLNIPARLTEGATLEDVRRETRERVEVTGEYPQQKKIKQAENETPGNAIKETQAWT